MGIFLTCKPAYLPWKGNFSYDQLPSIITNVNRTFEEVFLLFSEKEHFIVEDATGTITVILKTVEREKIL